MPQGSQVGLPLLIPSPPAAGRCGSCIYKGNHLNSRYRHLDINQLGRFIQCWGHERPNLAPLAPSGTLWHHLAPSGTVWHRLAPSGTVWHLLVFRLPRSSSLILSGSVPLYCRTLPQKVAFLLTTPTPKFALNGIPRSLVFTS